MKLSIIILNYNTKNLLRTCLTSLFRNTKGLDFEVIVVDNASKDKSIEMVKQEFKKVKVIANKRNFGFSRGCNIGAEKAQGEYLLFLNSDIEVLDNGIKNMVSFMKENSKVDILGGRIKNPNGSNQRSSGKFYTLGNVFVLLFGGERFGFSRYSPSRVQVVDWVSGACFMIKKEVFQKLNGFDEHFFMYIEDMEICYRANQQGFRTYFYPNVLMIHNEHGSSSRRFAIVNIYKGILYFYKKHMTVFQYDLAKWILKTKADFLFSMGNLVNNDYLRDTYEECLSICKE